jgi:hypothetical protein
VQGEVDNRSNLVNVRLHYTVTGSLTTLPAYSNRFTIAAANTQDNATGIVATFGWEEQQNLAVGSGTFNATITTDRTYNAKKLKIKDAGIKVATFTYPKDDSFLLGTATLKVIPGILDREFGKADNNKDTDMHSFLYLPVTNPATGRTWLNNNLGAEYAKYSSDNFKPAQQAKSSTDYLAYGSLFQWGRKADGHELIDWASDGQTGTGKHKATFTKSNKPDDASFIIEKTSPYDWRVYLDDTLWENASGVNSVCPVGYGFQQQGSGKKKWIHGIQITNIIPQQVNMP